MRKFHAESAKTKPIRASAGLLHRQQPGISRSVEEILLFSGRFGRPSRGASVLPGTGTVFGSHCTELDPRPLLRYGRPIIGDKSDKRPKMPFAEQPEKGLIDSVLFWRRGILWSRTRLNTFLLRSLQRVLRLNQNKMC